MRSVLFSPLIRDARVYLAERLGIERALYSCDVYYSALSYCGNSARFLQHVNHRQ